MRRPVPREHIRAAADVWNRFWFTSIPVSTYAVFRIAFALLVLGWTSSLGGDLLDFYSSDGILPEQPAYSGADEGAWGLLGISSSDGAVIAVYVALVIATLCLLVGFGTRVAAVVVFLTLLALTRRNPWVLNSGDVLIRVLAFYAMFIPAGAALSVDRWLKTRRSGESWWGFPERSGWGLRLIQVQMSILYFTAFWVKSGPTWHEGIAVSYALRVGDLERLPVPEFITTSALIANLMTYGTLAVEFALGVLVWKRKLRPWVLLLGVSLHLGIDYAVRVGFFSYAILVLYIAFIPPETMSAWLTAARRRLERLPLGRRLAAAAAPAGEPGSSSS